MEKSTMGNGFFPSENHRVRSPNRLRIKRKNLEKCLINFTATRPAQGDICIP